MKRRAALQNSPYCDAPPSLPFHSGEEAAVRGMLVGLGLDKRLSVSMRGPLGVSQTRASPQEPHSLMVDGVRRGSQLMLGLLSSFCANSLTHLKF